MASYIERPRYFCSLGGALSTLEALPETIPVLHCAMGCAGSIAWAQNGGSALQVGGYCGGLTVPSSNVGEREVVFGGTDRLREQIENTIELMDGRLFVVVTGCVTEIIGDDIRAVTSEFSDRADIVAANTGGFKGNSYLGYDIVMSAIVRQYVKKNTAGSGIDNNSIDSGENDPHGSTNTKSFDGAARKKSVNVLGIVPYMDVFWRGNLLGVRRLLEKLGVLVNTFFTDEDTLDGVRNSASADLNIVLSDVYGLETARTYEDVHGVPFISSALPIGPTASAELLRTVANALKLDIDVEAIIEKESRRYYGFLDPIVDTYNDIDLQRYSIIIGDVNYAVAVTRFLADDLGWPPVLVQFTDTLNAEEQERIAAKLKGNGVIADPKVVFDTNASQASKYIGELYPRRDDDRYAETLTPAFVVGSSLDRALAQKLGAGHLSVSFPVSNRAALSRGYTGFDGGLTLVEDLIAACIALR